MSDDEILQHKKLALLEMVTKHIHDRDFFGIIFKLVEAFMVVHGEKIGLSLVSAALSYLINAREEYEIKPLVEELITNIQDYEDTVMTYAEVLRKEG